MVWVNPVVPKRSHVDPSKGGGGRRSYTQRRGGVRTEPRRWEDTSLEAAVTLPGGKASGQKLGARGTARRRPKATCHLNLGPETLQTRSRVKLCCFKSPHWWGFMAAATGDGQALWCGSVRALPLLPSAACEGAAAGSPPAWTILGGTEAAVLTSAGRQA